MVARPRGRRARPRGLRALRTLFTRDWRGGALAVVVLVVIIVLAALPFGGPRHSQLSAYDDDWDDVSYFRRDLEGDQTLPLEVRTIDTSATALLSIENASDMLYIAIGVERPYSFSEWRALREFRSRGGLVWIADDYGEGNSLLKFNGFGNDPAFTHTGDKPQGQYVFSGERLVDVHFERNTLLVRSRVDFDYVEMELLLNDPSCFVENRNWDGPRTRWDGDDDETSAKVYVASSHLSWIDRDRNGERSPGELNRSYPLMIYQEGWLLLSDPSIFTNDMYWRADNAAFIRFMITYLLPKGGKVIIDESLHLEPGLLGEVDDIVLRPFYILLGEGWPCFSGLIGMAIAMVFGLRAVSRRVRKLTPHVDRLAEPRVGDFGSPINWVADYYEVRGVLLQRLRYAYGLEPEELPSLPPALVAQLLGDEALAAFTLRPATFDQAALLSALEVISTWRPPPDAEAVMDRVEAYLAAARGGPPPPPGAPQAQVQWAVPRPPYAGGPGVGGGGGAR